MGKREGTETAESSVKATGDGGWSGERGKKTVVLRIKSSGK